MEYLKLNKYLVEIIREYAFIDLDKLHKNDPKYRHITKYLLNPDITIEDIIAKCYNLGYMGFSILCGYEFHIRNIDHIINSSISTDQINSRKIYNLKKDKRDLYFIDMFDIENVLIRTIEICDNKE